MIIVKLKGGLGNQMFQYALGRSVALEKGFRFKLDTSEYKTYKLRDYRICNFRIKATIAKRTEVLSTMFRMPYLFAYMCARFSTDNIKQALMRGMFYENERFIYDNRVLEQKNRTYFDGYWQNINYFRRIAPILRKEFYPCNELSIERKSYFSEINSSNSVAVHIRRGDYVNDPATKKIHNCCEMSYYKQAVAIIRQRVENPKYFVFSDDTQWVCKFMQWLQPSVIISGNEQNADYEDIYLMRNCQHHIIANSTFSWWGAWLCENPNQVVIAPKVWFNSTAYDISGLIPEKWIQLSN